MIRYCLDSNVFIEGWNKYYSMDLCPDYWEILDQLAQERRIFASIEVKREIESEDGGLKEWLRQKDYFFKDITVGVQIQVRDIMANFPRLVDSTRQRSIADPWVIALAREENAIVVTKEMPASNGSKRIKIPDVCNELRIPWMDDFKFAHSIGIRFAAQLHPEQFTGTPGNDQDH